MPQDIDDWLVDREESPNWSAIQADATRGHLNSPMLLGLDKKSCKDFPSGIAFTLKVERARIEESCHSLTMNCFNKNHLLV